MDLKEFIANFADQFEETDAASLTADTLYKDLDEWSSLVAMSVLSMVVEEYGVELMGEDIRNTETIGELFNLVQERA